MDNISNVSSEEELQQMLEEGRISQQEYEELRAAMQSPNKKYNQSPPEVTDKTRTKRKLGKVAFTLILAAITMPLIGAVAIGLTQGQAQMLIVIIAKSCSLVLFIAALVTAIIAWPDVFAKVTIITIAILVALAIINLILYNSIQQNHESEFKETIFQKSESRSEL